MTADMPRCAIAPHLNPLRPIERPRGTAGDLAAIARRMMAPKQLPMARGLGARASLRLRRPRRGNSALALRSGWHPDAPVKPAPSLSTRTPPSPTSGQATASLGPYYSSYS